MGRWRSREVPNLKKRPFATSGYFVRSSRMVPGDDPYISEYMVNTSDEKFSDAIIEFVHIDYFDLLKIEGVKGSFFHTSESQIPGNSVVVNESFAKRLGWKDVENKEIIFEPRTKDEKSKPVSGIFKDFHFHSLHQPIQPVILSVGKAHSTSIKIYW